ncbi:palmitoyltransferase pfa5 [Scheffersomyces spartinae]|uniref:Palmitoyltransferase pfa5 n=1 Tax=Scheffersomyces spartinae TaxID=45513 RepID=A0A9P7VE29_9ASCO|nr:palmitoyltransferase pfa5 [Scheffersomyces spartinae]KAG7196134.1 palmitoyltransferase pfa5 [Scheffersomyces spartinae]
MIPISFLWVWFAGALLAQHTVYVRKDLTTIEDLSQGRFKRFKALEAYNKGESKLNPVQAWFLKRQKRPPNWSSGQRFVSIAHEDFRLVVEFTVFDNAYSLGWKRNLINLIFNENSHHKENEETQFYSNSKYLMALFMYFIPLVDLPLLASWRLHDSFVKAPDESDAKFYSRIRPKFNSTFNEYLRGRVERKECYIPQYLGLGIRLAKPESDNQPQFSLSLLTADAISI